MSEVEDEIRRFLLARLPAEDAPRLEQLDLFEAGVLDSIALTELVEAVERRSGRELDFIEVDPDELGSFAGVVEQLSGALD